MRVRDLQEFLSTFTAKDKSGTKQGNAISDAVIFVEINGYLEEIRKMEVYENNQTIFGATKNHHSHRLVMKTKRDQKIILPDKLHDSIVFVEINGYLEEIRKMEVYENNQTIFGATKNHHSHRLVMKTKRDQKIILPDKLHDSIV